jgi:hypothetical protein
MFRILLFAVAALIVATVVLFVSVPLISTDLNQSLLKALDQNLQVVYICTGTFAFSVIGLIYLFHLSKKDIQREDGDFGGMRPAARYL